MTFTCRYFSALRRTQHDEVSSNVDILLSFLQILKCSAWLSTVFEVWVSLRTSLRVVECWQILKCADPHCCDDSHDEVSLSDEILLSSMFFTCRFCLVRFIVVLVLFQDPQSLLALLMSKKLRLNDVHRWRTAASFLTTSKVNFRGNFAAPRGSLVGFWGLLQIFSALPSQHCVADISVLSSASSTCPRNQSPVATGLQAHREKVFGRSLEPSKHEWIFEK